MTPYKDIYDVFELMSKDFNLYNLTEPQKIEIETSLLKSAITEFDNSNSDLSNRDDIAQEFIDDLSEKEIEILATGMAYKWLNQFVLNSDLLKQYNLEQSSANKLKQNRNTMITYKNEMNSMIVKFGYSKGWS